MKHKKPICLLLSCIALFGCVCMNASAAGIDSRTVTIEIELGPRATGSFSTRIPANSAYGAIFWTLPSENQKSRKVLLS